jgi:putative restriction endonuclease
VRSRDEQDAIRRDVFRWLDVRLGEGMHEFTRDELASYEFDGERIPLVDQSRGIRNPRDFEATLSILTSSKSTDYADEIEPGGLLRYSYRSQEGGDNVKLRRAFETEVPLVYFRGVRPNFYQAFYPVHVVGDDPVERVVKIALDAEFEIFGDPFTMTGIQKRYAERSVRQRLHQPLFRALVLNAYDATCAVCGLAVPQMLEAAHIIPDAHEDGLPAVSNGIALCVLHHAAFDGNLIGIDADGVVHVSKSLEAVSTESDLFEVGLRRIAGKVIARPRRRIDRPLVGALKQRFEEFTATGRRIE